jgi:hypothetical protein
MNSLMLSSITVDASSIFLIVVGFAAFCFVAFLVVDGVVNWSKKKKKRRERHLRRQRESVPS